MKNISLDDKEKISYDVNAIIDNIGLILIGLFSLGYCLFHKIFAELCISFSFLDFPVFVGEILFFICLTLLLIKWKLKPQKITRWHYLLFSYSGFVLIKTFWGYLKWGPLALRHAALFYYPLFALFGYIFYRRSFFNSKKSLFLILLFIVIFKFVPFYTYFFFTIFILTFLLIKAYPYKIIKILCFLLLFIFTPWSLFLKTSRTFIVANLSGGIYIIISLFCADKLILKKKLKMFLFILLLFFLVGGISVISDKNAVMSMLEFKFLVNMYREKEEFINKYKLNFHPKELKKINLFNPALPEQLPIQSPKPNSPPEQLPIQSPKPNSPPEQLPIQSPKPTEQVLILAQPINQDRQPFSIKASRETSPLTIQESINHTLLSKQQTRNLDTAYANSLFRIFIWRDMLRQIKERKPILGFDFGWPLRSQSLEILNWAVGEWERDGWISAHNSFLDIIYRAGIIGLLVIVIIFMVLVKMIKISIQLRLLTGILLSGILINWLVAANFLEILQLPYHAIPFWSLYGITYAYLFKVYKSNENTYNS